MSFLQDAKSLWQHLINNTTPDQATSVIMAVLDGVHETASGQSSNVLTSIAKNNPAALSIIEDITKSAATLIGGPLAGAGVGIAIGLLSMSHTMTPEEQQVWFDRQKSDA